MEDAQRHDATPQAARAVSRRQFGRLAAGGALGLGVAGLAGGSGVDDLRDRGRLGFPETRCRVEAQAGAESVEARFLLRNDADGAVTVIKLKPRGRGRRAARARGAGRRWVAVGRAAPGGMSGFSVCG